MATKLGSADHKTGFSMLRARYFNNHYHGYAPENCLYLIERLGLQSAEQKRAMEKTAKKQSQLQSFF